MFSLFISLKRKAVQQFEDTFFFQIENPSRKQDEHKRSEVTFKKKTIYDTYKGKMDT